MSRLICVAALLMSGCGGDSGVAVVTAPVSGKVTMNGQPLEGATVNFVTDNYSSSGITKADGTYSLPTGAAIGENRVFITKFVAPEGFSDDPEDGLDAGQVDAANIDPLDGDGPSAVEVDKGEKIPAEFSNPDQSKLTIPVPEAGNSNANFALTSS
jgi:hypothetical protein